MTRKADHYWPPDVLSADEVCELINTDARLAPHTIRGLYIQTGRSFWVDRETWIEANTRLALQVERLLMPCGEDIIREIRAARGTIDPGVPTDLTSFPVGTYPGVRTADVFGSLNTNGESAAFILSQIRDALRTEQDGETAAVILKAIAGIIVGVPV